MIDTELDVMLAIVGTGNRLPQLEEEIFKNTDLVIRYITHLYKLRYTINRCNLEYCVNHYALYCMAGKWPAAEEWVSQLHLGKHKTYEKSTS